MANGKSQSIKILEDQIRECYGRVVYSHKTHEKCAENLFFWDNTIQISQIVLSALTTSSFIPIVLGAGWEMTLVGGLLSLLLLFINTYVKKNNLYELGLKHKQVASNLWLVREQFLSLLTDLRMKNAQIEKIQYERDRLNTTLHGIYSNAPSTTSAAYKSAQKALKINEEMTFSDEEIDVFLPMELRKTHCNDSHDRTSSTS